MVVAIVWASLTPAPPSAPGSDKVGHLAAYGALMFWFAQLYARRVAWAAGFVVLGVALEFAQSWTGYRSFEVNDMLANTAGVGLGWGAALLLRRRLFP